MTIRGRRLPVTALVAVVLVLALGTAALAQGTENPGTPTTATSDDDAGEDAAEAEEQARLAESAAITEGEAVDAAQKLVAGEVTGVELEEDNGTLVYEVEIAGTDVSVDAVSGDIVGQDVADNDDSDQSEESDDIDEPDDGVDHQHEWEGEDDPEGDHED